MGFIQNPPTIMYSKIYILIKDTVDVGHAVNCAAHASLILYLRNEDNFMIQDWVKNSFRKVSCKVSEQVFEKAKEMGCEYEIVTEDTLDDKEVALVFHPRKEWPKFFQYLQLYN